MEGNIAVSTLNDGVAWGLRSKILCTEVLRILLIVIDHTPSAGKENQFMLSQMFRYDLMNSTCLHM